jgi:FtsP/CotA-like multicopper oxidase with cupredoxin domain
MNIFATKIHKVISLFFFMLLPTLTWAAQREFSLTIDEVSIEVAPGFTNKVFAFNGQVPGPLIHVKEGDDVTVHVTNNTSLPHTIHWHGINQIGTWHMDGVPDVTQEAIQPGESFVYKFNARSSRQPCGTTAMSMSGSMWRYAGCGGR